MGGRGSLAGQQAPWKAAPGGRRARARAQGPARSRAQPSAQLQAADCSAPRCPAAGTPPAPGRPGLASASSRASRGGSGDGGSGQGCPRLRGEGGQGPVAKAGKGDTTERSWPGFRAARHLPGGGGGGKRNNWPPGGARATRTGLGLGAAALVQLEVWEEDEGGRDAAAPSPTPQPPCPPGQTLGTVPPPSRKPALRFQAPADFAFPSPSPWPLSPCLHGWAHLTE